MQEPRRVQILTETQAEDDAENGLAPDVSRVFRTFDESGLPESIEATTEEERLRITEIYAMRYALRRASLQAKPDNDYDPAIPWTQNDELLNLILSEDGSQSTPELLSQAAILHLLAEPEWRREDTERPPGLYASMIRNSLQQLIPQVSHDCGLPPDPDSLNSEERERLADALREWELTATITPVIPANQPHNALPNATQAQLTHRSALVGAELLTREADREGPGSR